MVRVRSGDPGHGGTEAPGAPIKDEGRFMTAFLIDPYPSHEGSREAALGTFGRRMGRIEPAEEARRHPNNAIRVESLAVTFHAPW